MRLPFVSRERYDELRAAHMDILEKYHALLATPSAPPKAAKPSKPVHDPLVDNMAAAFVAEGKEPDVARAEAARIKRAALGL